MDKAKRELLLKQSEGLMDDALLTLVSLPMPWTVISVAVILGAVFAFGVWVGA